MGSVYINAIRKTLFRVLTPSGSFRGVLKSKSSPINFEGMVQMLSETEVREIAIQWY